MSHRRVACALVFALLAAALSGWTRHAWVAAQQARTVSGLVAGLTVKSAARSRAGRAGARARRATPPAGSRASAATRRRPAGAAWLGERGVAPAALAGTYLADMVTNDHVLLRRWEDRRERPVRVWLARGDSVPGWRPEFDAVAREAFAAWERAGVPVRFVFSDAPDDAEVRVSWTDSLANRRAGVTRWTGDADGWLEAAEIVLATRVSDGTRADVGSVRRITLHEVGHLLGLEHSPDPSDVMAPYVRTPALTRRDEATARLLYSIAPGPVAARAR